MQEAREIAIEPSTDFAASPLESDIFEWHFTIRGPEETDFEGGLYHGRILLPNNYPFAPPSLMFMTPNGRFELNKKVCLSITGHHPEYWQPAWGIRTVLVAIMGFLPTKSKGAIGGLDTSTEARKALALRSKSWVCKICHQDNVTLLPDVEPGHAVKAQLKSSEIPPTLSFGYESDKKPEQAQEQVEARTQEVTGRSSKDTPTSLSTSLLSQTPCHATDTRSGPQPTLTLSPPAPRLPTSLSPSVVPRIVITPTEPPPQEHQPVHRAPSNIPVWLDALILALGGVLVALVIRKLL
ncbi:MAG: ubiquitin-conjugating enzyme/RWD-like protein [Podila humilis]|nr:MAG: ubiquitin-conjugating enzyme/RWD-like protein [Podila humilis]